MKFLAKRVAWWSLALVSDVVWVVVFNVYMVMFL